AAAFIAQQRMQDALPHLKKAIALNPDNEVSWYRLSQAQMALGNTAEQQKAFAEFQRLRTQKSSQQEAARELCSRSEVTERKLDWLKSSCVCVTSPTLTTTRAPIALRFDFVPTSFTFSQ